jgi:hypothetical protein
MSSQETQPLDPSDWAGIHDILIEDFTRRYLKKAHATAIAYPATFNQASELSDYSRTSWEADPNRLVNPAAYVALSALIGKSPRTVKSRIFSEVDARVDDIGTELKRRSLMFITGHTPDIFAALPLRQATRKVAEGLPGNPRENLYSRIHNTRVVATRGFVPTRLRLPHKPGNEMTLVRAAQLVFALHFTFPRTKTMLESGIPLEFIEKYNDRARADMVKARWENPYFDGLQQLWGMAPSAGPDIKGEKLAERFPDLPKDAKVVQKVTPGTAKLIQSLGVSIMPVYSKFGKGASNTFVTLGEIIPPELVTLDSLHMYMRRMCVFRQVHGEKNVHYEPDIN